MKGYTIKEGSMNEAAQEILVLTTTIQVPIYNYISMRTSQDNGWRAVAQFVEH